MMTMTIRKRRRLRGSANPRVALDRSMDAALAELEAKVAALADGYAEGGKPEESRRRRGGGDTSK